MLQKSYICCDVRHQCLIHLSRSLMLCSNRQSSASPILTSPTFNGSSPVRDGGLGVRRVSSLAFPAFLASAASTQSLQDDILTDCVQSESDFLQSYLAVSSAKFLVIGLFQTHYRQNSHSGIALVCSRTKLRWKPAWFQHTIGHHSQLLPVNTAEIGCLHYPSPRAD